MIFQKVLAVLGLPHPEVPRYPKPVKAKMLDLILTNSIERVEDIVLIGPTANGVADLFKDGRYVRIPEGSLKTKDLKRAEDAVSSAKFLTIISESLENQKKLKPTVLKLSNYFEDIVVFYADSERMADFDGGKCRLTRNKFISRFSEHYQLVDEAESGELGLYYFKRK